MILSEGSIFGLISGCLTAIGLILSNIGANTKINLIIMILISLAISDSLSDALGIYYSTYKDDNDIEKSMKEAGKAFLGKSIIPLTMALIFFLSQNINHSGIIILILVAILFIYINIVVFREKLIRFINSVIFIVIILLNFYLGKKFA